MKKKKKQQKINTIITRIICTSSESFGSLIYIVHFIYEREIDHNHFKFKYSASSFIISLRLSCS